MKSFTWLICIATLLLGLAGCVPKRVVWSPDGTHAAVLGDDGLHICDATGAIGPMLIPQVRAAEWIPDGKHLAVIQSIDLKTWKEISDAFSAQATQTISPERTDKVRAALFSYDGDWSKLTATLMQKLSLNDQQITWTLIYLRDHEPDALKPHLGEHWTALASLTWSADAVRTYAISGAAATASPVALYLSSNGFKQLRISPNGRMLAVTVTDSNGDNASLFVVAADGTGDALPLGEAAVFCDWSADGKYLVYIHPTGEAEMSGNKAQFGTLSRRQVIADDGTLFTRKNLPGSEDLVGLLFDPGLRVRTARDGRIFFTSTELTLPITAADMDPKPQIFCINPGKQATVSRVIPRSELAHLGDATEFFELSPDDAHLSVPFNDGRVSIVDLSTGVTDIVQDKPIGNGQDLKLPTVPAWRSPTELTFARPTQDGKQEIVLYSLADKKTTVLSAHWPKEIGAWAIGDSSQPTPPSTNKSATPFTGHPPSLPSPASSFGSPSIPESAPAP